MSRGRGRSSQKASVLASPVVRVAGALLAGTLFVSATVLAHGPDEPEPTKSVAPTAPTAPPALAPPLAPAAPAAPTATTEVPTIPVTQTTLDNGMVVLMSRDTRLPVVAVEVRYLVGSAHERAGKSGFAHLFEHLMFQGSKNHDKEYFDPYEAIGGEVNGTTSNDRTNYYERVPSQYLELALWMESDRMENLLPVLTQGKLDNQRDVVKNERRQSYENRPYGMFWQYLAETMYPEGHPYHHTTIGSHEDLTNATLDDVKGFFREYYTPTNAVLTIVGDFDPEKTLKLVKDYFGMMPAGKRAPKPAAPKVLMAGPVHLTKTDTVQFPRVSYVWHTPALYAPGDASMDVLASVLTDGKTSRLYKPLVYDKPIAQDVQAYQVSRQLGSVFVVEATAAPDVSVEVLAAALGASLAKALNTPPTADELERSVNGWQKLYYDRLQGVIPRASTLSTFYHFTGDPDYLAKDVARYTNLTADQVFTDSTAYLNFDQVVRIDIVPAAPEPPAPAAVSKGAAQ